MLQPFGSQHTSNSLQIVLHSSSTPSTLGSHQDMFDASFDKSTVPSAWSPEWGWQSTTVRESPFDTNLFEPPCELDTIFEVLSNVFIKLIAVPRVPSVPNRFEVMQKLPIHVRGSWHLSRPGRLTCRFEKCFRSPHHQRSRSCHMRKSPIA